MQLKKKGDSAQIGGINQFMVTLKWTSAMDFDLCAVYETRDGKEGIVYYADQGDLNSFPHMQLSDDEGVGDTGGDNQEDLRVMNLAPMKKIYVFCWDYTAVENGSLARFNNSDISVNIIDDNGKQYNCSLDNNNEGNVVCMAEIDNSSPLGARFTNRSSVGKLNGLENLSQLLAVAKGI